MAVPFERLTLKKQKRFDQIAKPLSIVGMDSETNPAINRTELIAAETGDYELPSCFEDCAYFLLRHRFRGKHIVFYNLQFDAQAIIKWIDDIENWRELWDYGETVYLERWHISLIPWKMFKIHDLQRKHSITCYDISQFYDYLTLDEAAKRYLHDEKIKTVDRLNLDFNDPETIKYCVYDAKLAGDLARLIIKVQDDHFPDSPKTLISKAGVSERHFRKICNIPTINNLIARYPNFIKTGYLAYKGGFFEAFKKGYFPKLYVYDINSAYPCEMAGLPDISQGRFMVKCGHPAQGANMGWLWVDCHIDFTSPISYFSPIAIDHKALRFYPYGTFRSVITLLEYEKLRHFFRIKPLKGIYWIPKTDSYDFPFEKEINRLYEWKSTEADIILVKFIKITLNSLYGKTIQKIPDLKTDKFITGNLFNPFYASYITAGTRMKIFDALLTMNPEDIVMVATDSITSLNPINVPVSNKLGEWGIEKQGRGVILGSGVYSIEDNEKVVTKQRGFKSLKGINFLDKSTLKPSYNVYGELIPNEIEIDVKNHFSLARAILSKDFDKMNLILQDKRKLNINFDYRRQWLGEFKEVAEITEKRLDSLPLNYDIVRMFS